MCTNIEQSSDHAVAAKLETQYSGRGRESNVNQDDYRDTDIAVKDLSSTTSVVIKTESPSIRTKNIFAMGIPLCR